MDLKIKCVNYANSFKSRDWWFVKWHAGIPNLYKSLKIIILPIQCAFIDVILHLFLYSMITTDWTAAVYSEASTSRWQIGRIAGRFTISFIAESEQFDFSCKRLNSDYK